MNYRKKTVLVNGILLLMVGSVCFAESVIETEHFTVNHEGVGKTFAELAARSAERSFSVITAKLGHEPRGEITIILTDDQDTFKTLTKGRLPDWSTAAALPGNRIVLSPLEGHKIALERIISHEIVHCVIDDAAGEIPVPRWFHEGCAQILSGRWGIRDRMYMTWMVVRGNLMTFDDIQHVFSVETDDATLAYDQSMIAVLELMRVHGGGVLREVIGGMKNGVEFTEAFTAATGIKTTDFERHYLAYLKKSYGRRSLLRLIPGTWTVIMMLAVLVYIVKKYRNRRLLREWEKSEKPGNIINFRDFPPDE